MKHKILKLIIMIAIIIMVFNNYNVLANKEPLKDPLTNPDYYDSITNSTNDTALITMGGKVLGIINTIGVVASVIVLMILGIKYMVGSVEEKAEYKKSMLAYVIGAVMVFGITTIANIIYTIATTALN